MVRCRRRLHGHTETDLLCVPIQTASSYDDHSPRANGNGTEVTKAVDKDLLVGANWCACQHDPDAPPGSSQALSHRASDVVCSRRMLPRPIRAPAAQSARAPIMLGIPGFPILVRPVLEHPAMHSLRILVLEAWFHQFWKSWLSNPGLTSLGKSCYALACVLVCIS